MRSPRILASVLVITAGMATFASSVEAQLPAPRVRDLEQRSGLVSRYRPVPRTLPHDPDRDDWHDTRWTDKPDPSHVNCVFHGGLYGLRYANRCTACVYPFFRGAPGASTIGPECEPKSHDFQRLYDNFLHPWRPVGMYYSKGCYVPIYDLDPLVTGPGPFPFHSFLSAIKGG